MNTAVQQTPNHQLLRKNKSVDMHINELKATNVQDVFLTPAIYITLYVNKV